MVSEINWDYFNKAISFYKECDYEYIKVPWKIPRKYINITRNIFPDDDILEVVGSAEQSFIYLDLLKKLSKRKYVSITPCFRTENLYDEFHQPWFMKVELYQNYDVDKNNFYKMVGDAWKCFQVLNENICPEIIETNEGIDLNIKNIEIGSYGIRTYKDLTWIYGTGLAEPRFSTAANRIEI